MRPPPPAMCPGVRCAHPPPPPRAAPQYCIGREPGTGAEFPSSAISRLCGIVPALARVTSLSERYGRARVLRRRANNRAHGTDRGDSGPGAACTVAPVKRTRIEGLWCTVNSSASHGAKESAEFAQNERRKARAADAHREADATRARDRCRRAAGRWNHHLLACRAMMEGGRRCGHRLGAHARPERQRRCRGLARPRLRVAAGRGRKPAEESQARAGARPAGGWDACSERRQSDADRGRSCPVAVRRRRWSWRRSRP